MIWLGPLSRPRGRPPSTDGQLPLLLLVVYFNTFETRPSFEKGAPVGSPNRDEFMFDTEKLQAQLQPREKTPDRNQKGSKSQPREEPAASRGPHQLRIGIDTGGTFTDFVWMQEGKLSIFKLPSTPGQPSEAVLEGLSRIVQKESGFLVQHGSTVATNALLERKGARTALLTTQGFEDVLEIGRQNRPGLYDLSASRPAPLVEPRFRIGVKERLAWDGSVLLPLEEKSVHWLANKLEQLKPDSVAVVLLYSFINPEHERRLGEALRASKMSVSLSCEVLPEFREYERTSATVINAYLRPVMSSYLDTLVESETVKRGRLSVMQSNGGSISPQAASRFPVNTLFSGPAGGVTGAFELCRQAGYQQVITFDMGGTSTDVSLCDGKVTNTREAAVGELPVPVQMIDINTVGAGGGSLAWVDAGGLLRVGPRSAGADPGPVCYGKGEEVTVTDANLYLGLLDPGWFLGGKFPLSPEKVGPALEALSQQLGGGKAERDLVDLCLGIRRIVETQMESAIRVISLESGYDTRQFSLVSFGGSGGLHACDLARSLLIPRIIIPSSPGVLSALGVLAADVAKDASRTVHIDLNSDSAKDQMEEVFKEREGILLEAMADEGFKPEQVALERSLDARYLGQSWELNVPFGNDFLKAFHDKHEQFYGYSNEKLPVEVVTLRVRASASHGQVEIPRFDLESAEPPAEALIQESQIRFGSAKKKTRFYSREELRPGNQLFGPAIVLEYSSTTYLPEDFQARVDEWRNLILEPVK